MSYSSEQVEQLNTGHAEIRRELRDLQYVLVTQVAESVSGAAAREYVLHGIGRRVKVVARAIDNVFRAYPPGRESLLTWDELTDIQINLHAFMTNVYGVLDNVAWAFVHHHGLVDAIGSRMAVGLFKPATQRYLPEPLAGLLNEARLVTWHDVYAKNYRDALAHRIPLYIPPSVLDPQDEERHKRLDRESAAAYRDGDLDRGSALALERDLLGRPSTFFVHSLGVEMSPRVQLHPQLISDARTIIEITKTFATCFQARAPDAT